MLHQTTQVYARRLVRCALLPLNARRCYSNGQYGGSAGATTHTRDWGEKEKAVEGQWARVNDQERLKELRDTLEKQKTATGELRKDVDDLKKMLDKKNQ